MASILLYDNYIVNGKFLLLTLLSKWRDRRQLFNTLKYRNKVGWHICNENFKKTLQSQGSCSHSENI